MRLPTRSPFLQPTELLNLHQLLFNPTLSSTPFNQQRTQALELISLYLNRSNCPHAIESTAFLIQSQILDESLHSTLTSSFSSSSSSTTTTTISSSSSQAHLSSRLSYAIAITRFVNSIVDSEQNGFYAQSINSIAERIGLPLAFVELRHASTHEELPSLQSLRQATVAALEWLDVHYWRPTLDSLFPPSQHQSHGQINAEHHQPIASSSSSKPYSPSNSYSSTHHHDRFPDALSSSEPFKIPLESLTRLRNLLKTYKKISKSISKDFSLKGSLSREIGELVKEIEDWIRETGRTRFEFHYRRNDSSLNSNFVELGSSNEREKFHQNRFNRKRRRFADSSDGEDFSTSDRELERSNEIEKLGLEIFFKELLQIGGLVPLGIGKRMVFRDSQDKATKSRGKGKLNEHDSIPFDAKEGKEDGEGSEENQDQQEEAEKEVKAESERESNFTSNGIQILPKSIINQWSTLLNHLATVFKDSFSLSLTSQLVECLVSGLPLMEIDDGTGNTSSTSSNPAAMSHQKSFPKGYKETLSSWLIHLLETKKEDSRYALVSSSSSNWGILQTLSGSNRSIQLLKESDLDFRKPKSRLALLCLSSTDEGKSALPILKYLASTTTPSADTEVERSTSLSSQTNSQDLLLSKVLKPLIEKLESSKNSSANSIQPEKQLFDSSIRESSSQSADETGFEDSLRLMKERLESLGKNQSQLKGRASKERDESDERDQNQIKKARFSDNLVETKDVEIEMTQDQEHNRHIRDEQEEKEEDEDDDGEEDRSDSFHDLNPQDERRSPQGQREDATHFSMTRMEGWNVPKREEWEPCPIGMLRGEIPNLELNW